MNIGANRGYFIGGWKYLHNAGFGSNTFVGEQAGYNVIGNTGSTFIGQGAGSQTTIATQNTFIGMASGYWNTSGSFNTFVGATAGENNDWGTQNVFVGWQSGWKNTQGFGNTFIGNSAGEKNEAAYYNTFVGDHAGYKNLTGNRNTHLGKGAGETIVFGNDNTFIGAFSGSPLSTGATNRTAIGALATVTLDNSMVLGSITPAVNVGIGITAPAERLHVVGNIRSSVLAGIAPSSVTVTNDEGVVVANTDGTMDKKLDFINDPTQYLRSDGTWGIPPGGSALPASPNFSVQFNNNNAFGGHADLTWDNTNYRLGIGTNLPSERLHVSAGNARFDGNAILTGTSLTTTTSASLLTFDGSSLPNHIFLGDNDTKILAMFPVGSPFNSDGGIFLADLNSSGSVRMRVDNDPNNRMVVRINQNNDKDIEIVNGTGDFVRFNGIDLTPSFWTAPMGIDIFGDLTVYGTFTDLSDTAIKQNINPLSDPLNMVMGLNAKSFYYDTAQYSFLNLSSSKQYGFQAQDIEQTFPEMVKTITTAERRDDNGNIIAPSVTVKTLNTLALVPWLAEAVKEQKLITDSTGNEIKAVVHSIDSIITVLSSPPVAPQLLAPSNGDVVVDTASTSRFVWSSVKGAVLYHFQVDIDSSFTPSKTLYDFVGIDTVSPMLGIRDTMIIYWRVRSKNGFGESPWSPMGYFTLISTEKAADTSRQAQPSEPQGRLSDAVFKQNVTPLTNSLATLQQLEGVTFTWDTVNNPFLPSASQLGMIAQQVLPYYPEAVFIDDSGYYRLDYERLVPVVVEAIKEQQSTIASQSLVIDSIRQSLNFVLNCLANLPPGMGCTSAKQGGNNNDNGRNIDDGNTNPSGGVINHELSSPRAILYQNQPNPFGDGTVIRFFIPEKVKSAQMAFYDEFGRELEIVDIDIRGNGEINLSTINLAGGIYTYSLIADGRVINTLQMIRNK